MAILENITRKVTDTAKAAAKKSGDIVELTKLNMSIGTEENKIEKAYIGIGKIVYDGFKKGEDVSQDLKEHCEKIKSCEENIDEIRQKIFELKKVKICTSCNAELDIEVAFCSKCGAKQEKPQPVAEEPIKLVCDTCGNENDLGAEFCTKCGKKIE